MKKLSAFDLGMIIAFVVIGLLGGGAWYYLSTQLSNAQTAATSASSSFNTAISKGYYPSAANEKILQEDNDTIKAQLDPVIAAKLQAPDNKLGAVQQVNPVDWKRDLDSRVSALTTLAKAHAVNVPANFYYGFSRYLNQQPGDEATAVLGKQLLGIEQVTSILMDSPVKSIHSIKRTYEEDALNGGTSTTGLSSLKADPDQLVGSALHAPNDLYISYPFEFDFECTTETFRKVIDGLMNSPYVFVIRSLDIENTHPDSPKISDLDTLSGANNPAQSAALDTPGATAASAPAIGPQFLFGAETLHVRARIDLIEWNGLDKAQAAAQASAPATSTHHARTNP
jgi:hypothetical protein